VIKAQRNNPEENMKENKISRKEKSRIIVKLVKKMETYRYFILQGEL